MVGGGVVERDHLSADVEGVDAFPGQVGSENA